MANEKVNSLITDLLKRAKQIESEDGKSFMELDELRRWAAAPMIDRRPVASRMARVLRKMALTSVFVEHGGGPMYRPVTTP